MYLNNILIDNFCDYCTLRFSLNEIEKIKLNYSLKVIINDLSKIVIFYFIFSLFNKEIVLLYSLVALIPVRSFTGGLHFKKYLSCLLFTIGFLLATYFSTSTFILTDLKLLLLCLFVIVVIITYAPLPSKFRPKYSNRKKLYFKLISLLIFLIHITLYIKTKSNYYFLLSLWVYFYQSIQLLIARGVILYEKNKEKKI